MRLSIARIADSFGSQLLDGPVVADGVVGALRPSRPGEAGARPARRRPRARGRPRAARARPRRRPRRSSRRRRPPSRTRTAAAPRPPRRPGRVARRSARRQAAMRAPTRGHSMPSSHARSSGVANARRATAARSTAAVGRDLRAAALDHRVAHLVGRVELVHDGVGRQRRRAQPLERGQRRGLPSPHAARQADEGDRRHSAGRLRRVRLVGRSRRLGSRGLVGVGRGRGRGPSADTSSAEPRRSGTSSSDHGLGRSGTRPRRPPRTRRPAVRRRSPSRGPAGSGPRRA